MSSPRAGSGPSERCGQLRSSRAELSPASDSARRLSPWPEFKAKGPLTAAPARGDRTSKRPRIQPVERPLVCGPLPKAGALLPAAQTIMRNFRRVTQDIRAVAIMK